MKEWYIYKNEAQDGPYTTEQLIELINKEEITEQTYIYDDNIQDWNLISQIPELTEYLPIKLYSGDIELAPVNKETFFKMLRTSEITENDYIFDYKINDWIFIKDSNLFIQFKNDNETEPETNDSNETEEKKEVKIQFPCVNHPDKESFLMCIKCNKDFCEECLVKVNNKNYCKQCYENDKENIDKQKQKKQSFFSKLFKKKK